MQVGQFESAEPMRRSASRGFAVSGDYGAYTDAELMVRVQCGEREAFAALVDRHKSGLVNYLARLTGNRDRAEDLAQEAFVRLYRTSSEYREQGKLVPLLYRIATNLLRSEDRRVRRWKVVTAFLPTASARPSPSPQSELLAGEVQRQVAQAVSALPLAYRVPLVLRDIEEWSYEEIAHATGCPEGTVKSRVSRARARLKEALAPYVTGGVA